MVVIIKSTEVPLNTLHKCIVIVSREGGGLLPDMGYIGVCGAKGYGFFFFCRFGLKKGINLDQFGLDMFFSLEKATSSSLGHKTISLWVLG